jgi:7-cyano-7-deazaguanine synthase in queuosine biosynthesis
MITQRFPFNISFWAGSDPTTVNLRAGEHFRFDLDTLNRFCPEDLPARLVDFLRIASSIYVVDRLVKRRPNQRFNKPSRSIGLRISVFDAEFWRSCAVRDAIHEALDFVSGDFWDVEFVADTMSYYRRGRLFSSPSQGPSPLICLYSGGLDSVAGLAARIAQEPVRSVIPVTVWHQPRQRHLVREQLNIVRTKFSAVVDPLIVKVAMQWSAKLKRSLEEPSQRCRSFLFTTLGAIAAIIHGEQAIEVFESGVGAINLPLMAGMTGAKSTKSAHPKFLRLMSRLASLVAERDVEFCLPFQELTKGELVTNLRRNELEQLANLSASCVNYPQRHCKQKQCGVCPACILRRQAMATAGIVEPENAYEHDFLGYPQTESKIPAKRLQFLKAVLMQVAWLSGVESRGQLPSAFARHLISTEILGRNQLQEDLIELLVRYRDEWMVIASEAERKGHNWAKLLATHEPKMEGITNASA